MEKSPKYCSYAVLLAAALFHCAACDRSKPAPLETPDASTSAKAKEGWWSISDKDFFDKYKNLATSSQQSDRSKFAWMLFARVNQPAVDAGGNNFVAWELWASNPDTFPATGKPKWPDSKNRTKPSFLEKVKAEIIGSISKSVGTGEEVTRNKIDFRYIANSDPPLWQVAGLRTVYAQKTPVNFAIGSIEVKANWTTRGGLTDWGAPSPVEPDMYQIKDGNDVYGLNGLHVMAKIADTPADPFTSSAPSWFWTTFEYHGNPGRDVAIKFVTNPDALTPDQVKDLIGPAGLPKELAENYRCNGTQITFVNTVEGNQVDVVLGNTTMEGAFGKPLSPEGNPQAPSEWKSWYASCHTCHGEANMNAEDAVPSPPRFLFQAIKGPIPPGLVENTVPLDFSWPIPDQAVPRD